MNPFRLLLINIAIWCVCGRSISAPVRLVIVPETPETGPISEMLTVNFSKDSRFQLLERAEIDKVIREQGAAGGGDYLKLGQILGADGLLLLETRQYGKNEYLGVELIAVKPGAVLLGERFDWSGNDPGRYVAPITKLVGPLAPKLGTLAKEAIPLSVVNLRSAVQTAGGRDLESQLTFLAIDRLSREKHLFVLERRQMQLLSGEKEWSGAEDSAFWNGSYLLDGTVIDDGYPAYTVTINGRLVPPKGGQPFSFSVTGSRTNLGAVVDQLAGKIMESLQLARESTAWNAADEAAQYYEEARWAMKWGLHPQAQAASESAWALGRQDVETAALRVHAYSDDVPLGNENTYFTPRTEAFECLRVVAIPDAKAIKPLTHALEIFHQNASLLMRSTNSDACGAEIGVKLLGRTAGVLESYYYSVEARAGNEDALMGLRDAMRMVIADLDTIPFPPPVQNLTWNTPQGAFNWLKWEEGGMGFEQPEQAVPMFRQLLDTGYHPGHLPRLVGWSWPDRKRVPGLIRRFVSDAAASTNASVRLEGLFLQLLTTPNDENGSLQLSEEELTTAMWENRGLLFTNADFATLITRTHDALLQKQGDWYPVRYFDHEPFASMKHQLQMDFLGRITNANYELVTTWFPSVSSSEKLVTPEQARELLPLAVSCQERFKSVWAFKGVVRNLQQEAGATPATPVTVEPVQPAAEVLEVKFIPWNLQSPALGMAQKPRLNKMILRNGLLWTHVRYVAANSNGGELDNPDDRHAYVAADPRSGVKMEVPFPPSLGVPGDLFDVSSNALFVVADGHLFYHQFARDGWEEIPFTAEGASQMVWAGSRLFIGRNEGLAEVDPMAKTQRLLVSSRRQPPANEIDPFWMPDAKLFRWADDRLGVLSGGRCFSLDVKSGRWFVRGGGNLSFWVTNGLLSSGRWNVTGGGAQCFLPISAFQRDLAGFWNDDNPAQLLLINSDSVTNHLDRYSKTLQSPRWDWPRPYPLESSYFTGGDQTLWVLAPRKAHRMLALISEEPLKFSDSRDATLFCFEPAFRQPLAVAVQFEEDTAAEIPMMNGQVTGARNPLSYGFMDFARMNGPVNNGRFWLETPDGLVLASPGYSGHWLIPKSELESMFDSQRQKLRQQSAQNNGVPPGSQKP